jgi:hypothetical protein
MLAHLSEEVFGLKNYSKPTVELLLVEINDILTISDPTGGDVFDEETE